MGYQTVIKRAVLSGTTPRLTFQIVDEDGVGFKPDVLAMSIYDVTFPAIDRCATRDGHLLWPSSATHTLVNDRNDVDILASCDDSGHVDLDLLEEDTVVSVPTQQTPMTYQRRVLFRWEWDTDKVGKHEVILTIAPDRETVAT